MPEYVISLHGQMGFRYKLLNFLAVPVLEIVVALS